MKPLLDQLKDQKLSRKSLACGHLTNVWFRALRKKKKSIVNHLLQNEDDSLIMSKRKIEKSGVEGRENALHILIENNDIETVKLIFEKIRSHKKILDMLNTNTAVEIENQRPRRLSCLHFAAYKGQEELVKLFIEQGVHVDQRNDKKDTALLWAARNGHYKVVDYLINSHANVENENDKGSTALHWAVRYEHVKTVEILLENGRANPDVARKTGLVAPLIVAAAYGNVQ